MQNGRSVPGPARSLFHPFILKGGSVMAESNNMWFGNIYRQNWYKLFNVAFRLLNDRSLAEDITQNVFLTLYTKRESLRSHPNIQGWLLVTLRHQIWNETQKAFRTREVAMAPEIASAIDTGHAPHTLSFVDSLPDGLSEEERLLLYLFYDVGLTHGEIATRLDCSPEACRMRLYRAKAHCKQLMEADAADRPKLKKP